MNFILYHVIVTINNCSDLDLAAMKALGQVLNGLVLQPRGMTGDIFEQKSKLFQRYKYISIIIFACARTRYVS